MERIAIGLIGVGYWGANLARAASQLDEGSLSRICELRPDALSRVERTFPGVETTASVDDFFEKPGVDAVVVATPAATHFELAKRALDTGHHVLVEKPLASSVAECDELDALARARDLVLMAGHTFIYSNPVREIRRRLDVGELGAPRYASLRRLNMGRVRDDVNALWNLGPHDVSILDYVLGEAPTAVSAVGGTFIQPSIEDVVFLALSYSSGIVAHVELSWLSPVKVREMTLVCSDRMLVYDDTRSDAPLAIHDRGFDRVPGRPPEFHDFAEFQLIQRVGDTVIPQVPGGEPLVAELNHFVTAVRTGGDVETGATHARRVIAVLQAADEALRTGNTAPVPAL